QARGIWSAIGARRALSVKQRSLNPAGGRAVAGSNPVSPITKRFEQCRAARRKIPARLVKQRQAGADASWGEREWGELQHLLEGRAVGPAHGAGDQAGGELDPLERGVRAPLRRVRALRGGQLVAGGLERRPQRRP